MRSVLVVSDRPEGLDKLKKFLSPKHSVLTAAGEEALELINSALADVVVVDASEREGLLLLQKAKGLCPSCVIVCVVPSDKGMWEEEDLLAGSDFILKEPLFGPEVRAVIDRALEKQRLLEEVASLQGQAPAAGVPSPQSEPSQPALEGILKGFAKSLSAGFDLDRLLNLFLDTVAEMVHPSKASLLMLDGRSKEYKVEAYRGLSPKLVARVRLNAGEGLPLWLAREGRIIRRQEAEAKPLDPLFLEVGKELRALQATASIPLMARGSLVGILNLGHRITGLPYADAELETLFTLASHIAVAAQEIQLYHHTQYQKSYIEDILAHMSSGVINIDRDEKVIIFNHRAEEILKMKASEVLNHDLRCLPSPLGDLLFETLIKGKAYQKFEVEIPPDRLPLEVSTYQLCGKGGEALGSVMIFDDISSQRQLEEEKGRSERLDLLNRVVGWMAHEIKNPLVSIRTLTELLPERYDDPEFRRHFCPVVDQEVKNLNELVEKLATLAETAEYHYQFGEIGPLLDQCISSLRNRGLHRDIDISVDYQDELPKIKYDEAQLKRAFSYILEYLVKSTSPGGRVAVSTSVQGGPDRSQWVEAKISSTAFDLPKEKLEHIFDPFYNNSVFDLGLCVSRRIVEEHGGKISVEKGRRDKGINFSIRLPRQG